MIDVRTAPYAALALRVGLGLLFLAHAGLKIFTFTPSGTAQFFGSLGLPGPLAYAGDCRRGDRWRGVAARRLYAARGARSDPDLLGAIATVHGPAGFFFTAENGGWEFPAFWALALVVQAMLGSGAYALSGTGEANGARGEPRLATA
jgi:putative oxidoreductase